MSKKEVVTRFEERRMQREEQRSKEYKGKTGLLKLLRPRKNIPALIQIVIPPYFTDGIAKIAGVLKLDMAEVLHRMVIACLPDFYSSLKASIETTAREYGIEISDVVVELPKVIPAFEKKTIRWRLLHSLAEKPETKWKSFTCPNCGRKWCGRARKIKTCVECGFVFQVNYDDFRCRCKKCGHRWIRRSVRPRKCPKCETRKWKEK